MCRWLAYFGDPIRPEELLYRPGRSLIEQSRRGTPGAAVNNGDGYGLGWYGLHDRPGMFRSISPAWGDANLRELSAQIRSPLFLAHVRAATGTPVQQTNCHPFRHGRWLFVHNGYIGDFWRLRRELLLQVDPVLFRGIEGSTDSEVMFYLGLTFGLSELGAAHELPHELRGLIPASSAQCGADELEPDDPPLRPFEEQLDLGGCEVDTETGVEVLERLVGRELHVRLRNHYQLAAGLQASQMQRRHGAANQHEPHRGRQVLNQQIDHLVNRSLLDHMVVIEHKDERMRRDRKILDQLAGDRFSAGCAA